MKVKAITQSNGVDITTVEKSPRTFNIEECEVDTLWWLGETQQAMHDYYKKPNSEHILFIEGDVVKIIDSPSFPMGNL